MKHVNFITSGVALTDVASRVDVGTVEVEVTGVGRRELSGRPAAAVRTLSLLQGVEQFLLPIMLFAFRILELGFERIDLRDPTVVAVRPRDGVLPGQLVANGA